MVGFMTVNEFRVCLFLVIRVRVNQENTIFTVNNYTGEVF